MLWYRDATVFIFGVNSALDREQTLNHLTEYQIWLNGEVLLYKMLLIQIPVLSLTVFLLITAASVY